MPWPFWVAGSAGKIDEIDGGNLAGESGIGGHSGIEDGHGDAGAPRRVVTGDAKPIEQSRPERDGPFLGGPVRRCREIHRIDEGCLRLIIHEDREVFRIEKADAQGVERIDAAENPDAVAGPFQEVLKRLPVIEDEVPLAGQRAGVERLIVAADLRSPLAAAEPRRGVVHHHPAPVGFLGFCGFLPEPRLGTAVPASQ